MECRALSSGFTNLEKKLKEIKTLVMDKPKSLDNVEIPKPPKPPQPKGIKAPKANEQSSKKDPKKVAQQLKDADNKKMQMDAIKRGADRLIKFDERGQWTLLERD